MSDQIECKNCGITHEIKPLTSIANLTCTNCDVFGKLKRV